MLDTAIPVSYPSPYNTYGAVSVVWSDVDSITVMAVVLSLANRGTLSRSSSAPISPRSTVTWISRVSGSKAAFWAPLPRSDGALDYDHVDRIR